jgi:hypothetical protein
MKKITRKIVMVAAIAFFFAMGGYGMAMEGHSHDTDHKKDSDQAKDSKKVYPLSTCVVSGETLGAMGEPVTYTYKGQEIKTCCSMCINTIKADPEKYLKIVKDAYKDKAKKIGL